MPAAPTDRVVSGLLQKTHQINNTPSSQALVKSDSQQLMDADDVRKYKKIQIVTNSHSGGSRTSMDSAGTSSERSNGSAKITATQWWAIAILTFVNLINYMDRYTIAGVLGDVKSHYKIGDDQAGALQTIFVSSYMIVAPIFGYLGDRYSRRWLMVVGVSIWVVAVAAGSFMESFGWFMFFRALVGVGEASYSTIAPTLISDMFVKEARSKCLAIFYFAIPVGSGLGYVVGQQMSQIFGGWQWALRGTPILGVLAVVLIILCLHDPPRGGAEGHTEGHGEESSYSEDLRSLATNGSFVFSTLGFTCVTFCTGALSWWGPDFLQSAIRMKEDEVKELEADKVSFIFGLVTMLAGIFGVILGATSSTFLKRRWARADPVICGAGLASCSVLFSVALFHLAEDSVIASLVVIFFGMIAINLNWSIVADILLYVVAPNRRGTAEALQILLSHLFGDAGSPYLIGVVSEKLQKRLVHEDYCGHMANASAIVDPSSNSTRCEVAIQFYSMQYSMAIALFVVAVGALFFFLTSVFVVKDKRACDNFVNSKSGKSVEERGMLTPKDMGGADYTDEDEPPTLIAAASARSGGHANGQLNILKPIGIKTAYSPLENAVRFNKESDALLYTELSRSGVAAAEVPNGESARDSPPPPPAFARLLDSSSTSADSSLNSSSHSSSNNLIGAGNSPASPGGGKKSDADVVKEIINSSDFSVKLKSPAKKNSSA